MVEGAGLMPSLITTIMLTSAARVCNNKGSDIPRWGLWANCQHGGIDAGTSVAAWWMRAKDSALFRGSVRRWGVLGWWGPGSPLRRRADSGLFLLDERLNPFMSENQNGVTPSVEAPEDVVEEQAEDVGLWFVAETATEGYLQRALRRLHAAVEGKPRR